MTMGVARWLGPSIVVGTILASVVPGVAMACSPPFEEPTIRALGPGQMVVIGTIGDRGPDGRIFHVERWFNGGAPRAQIVITFMEGEAVGDCSYPVSTGQRLIIAPERAPDGRLSANLVTLQADPATDQGGTFQAEAIDLFGPGIVPSADVVPTAAAVPPQVEEPSAAASTVAALVASVGAAAAAVLVLIALHARRLEGR